MVAVTQPSRPPATLGPRGSAVATLHRMSSPVGVRRPRGWRVALRLVALSIVAVALLGLAADVAAYVGAVLAPGGPGVSAGAYSDAGEVESGTSGSGSPADSVEASTQYVVQPGDTLWSIAGELQPDQDRRATVDRLAARNGGAAIHAGQRLVVD